MRKFSPVFAALLVLVLSSGSGLAQRHGGPGHRGGPGDTLHRPPHGPLDSLRGGPRDTTKRPPNGGPDRGGRMGVKDSCFQVFLTQIPADSARMLNNDLNTLNADRALADSLRRQFGMALKTRDTVRAKELRAELERLHQQMSDVAKELKLILDQYKNELVALRKDCGGQVVTPPHKDDPTVTGFKMTPVVPNPVLSSTPATFTYVLRAATDVNITLSDMMGNVVQKVFAGPVTDTTPQTVTLDLSGLKPGVYILRVQAGKDVQSQKIMVQ
jgi:hypothetical protein